MEAIVQAIQAGDEKDLKKSLQKFVDKNKTNFKLNESLKTRKDFCSTVLGLLRQGYTHSPETLSLSLNALRIFSREHSGVEELVSREGLLVIAQLAELARGRGSESSQEELPADRTEVSRLVKHTGFGNAAGLLLSRGLLGGGRSVGEDQYSSDSESSDTEEYEQSRDKLDPVTGGPSQAELDPSPFDGMTEEQKEKEAEELAGLFDKLESHGVIKVMPVDKDGRPVLGRKSEGEESDND